MSLDFDFLAQEHCISILSLADRNVPCSYSPVMTLSAGGAQGALGHRFRAPSAYTPQLLTRDLHQHRAQQPSYLADFKG